MKRYALVILCALLGAQAQMEAAETLPTNDAAWLKAVNLVRFINIKRDKLEGKWRIEGSALMMEESGGSRVEIPYNVPEEYDFRVQFTVFSGREHVVQILAKSGRQFAWYMGYPNQTTFGFGKINGKEYDRNPSTVKDGPKIEYGKLYESVVQVRNDGLKGFLNGHLLAEWKTDYQDMSLSDGMKLHHGTRLGVGAYRSRVRFHRVELLVVSDKGQPVKVAAPPVPLPVVVPATPASSPKAASQATRMAAEAEARYKQSLAATSQQYVADLDAALQSAMRTGNLDEANAIRDVLRDIKDGKRASPQFKSTLANTAKNRYEHSATVAVQQYIRDLDAAQKAALNAGNLDEANAINATRKQLGVCPRIRL